MWEEWTKIMSAKTWVSVCRLIIRSDTPRHYIHIETKNCKMYFDSWFLILGLKFKIVQVRRQENDTEADNIIDGSSIYYVHNIFQQTNISYPPPPVIRVCTYTYHGGRNVSFPEYFVFLLYSLFYLIWYHFYYLKNVKKHPSKSVTFSKAEGCNFTKCNTLPWMFPRLLNCTNCTKSPKTPRMIDP